MLHVRLAAAGVAVLCVSACGLPVGVQVTLPGQLPATSVAVSSGAADGSAARAPSPGDSVPEDSMPSQDAIVDTSGIQSRGAGSKECMAVTQLMTSITDLGLGGATGDVTQEMVDEAFTADFVHDIPADAGGLFDALKRAGRALIGPDPTTTIDHTAAWEDSYATWVQAAVKICS